MAKELIDQGRLGKIFHYRANFLQDWTINADLPQGGNALWRLDAAAAGSGVTGDLLAHCIDTAIWLNGSITDVSAMTETFIKERPTPPPARSRRSRSTTPCSFMCHFGNGSLGLFESTRYARGHKALYTLEVNGEKASLKWDLHDLHRLQYFDYSDEGRLRGWKSIHVTTATSRIWVNGGSPACRSATSTASSTRSPTSWNRWARAPPAAQPSGCSGDPKGLRRGAVERRQPQLEERVKRNQDEWDGPLWPVLRL